MGRIELPSMVYETIALPLSHIGTMVGGGCSTPELRWQKLRGQERAAQKGEPRSAKLSGIPGLNRRFNLGKVTYYHYTNPAICFLEFAFYPFPPAPFFFFFFFFLLLIPFSNNNHLFARGFHIKLISSHLF